MFEDISSFESFELGFVGKIGSRSIKSTGIQFKPVSSVLDCDIAQAGGEHDDRIDFGLQRPMQEGNAIHIEHVHLVDEQQTPDPQID